MRERSAEQCPRADPDQAEVYALQDGRHKLILHEPGADEFFDLGADPLEARNLGLEQPEARRMLDELEERLRLFGTLSFGAGEAMPEEWLEELRDLGYVATLPLACEYDFNRDENIDLTDAQQMAQVFVGLISPEANWLDGDLNGDENADLTDAQILAAFVVSGQCNF